MLFRSDLVVCDYIGNMTTRTTRSDAKHWEKNGDAAEKLCVLAKKHNIPILTAQQINREAIRENRQKKEASKAYSYQQDAASGDQRLIHLSSFVAALESDKDNKMITYQFVKGRDCYFHPFYAKVDTDYNKILILTKEEEEEYRRLIGAPNPNKDGDNKSQNDSRSAPDDSNEIKTEFEQTNIYQPEDLSLEAVDDWES